VGTGGVSAGGVSASGASSASVGGVLVLVEDILDLGLDFVDDARHVCRCIGWLVCWLVDWWRRV
jgi:hypothetical protein